MNRLIQWFVENPIAANLLMAVIFIAGYMGLQQSGKEVFPSINSGAIEISMAYPGAGPAEVEEQICIRIEEAIADLNGIDEITSRARQGTGTVNVKAIHGYDSQRLLNDIKARVDAIISFPVDAERPRVKVDEKLTRVQLMSVAIYGNVDEAALKKTAQQVRDDLTLLAGVSQVDIKGSRPEEMAIEISETSLRHYNLSFEAVASAIRRASINLPAGLIRSDGGNIQLQTQGQAYRAEDFADIVIDSRADGAQLRLGDIAHIDDGFAEQDVIAQFDGRPAIFLDLFTTTQPDILTTTRVVRDYIKASRDRLPAGIVADTWRDTSNLFEGRMNLLLKNSASGLLLVFIILMLFLRPLLAAWVCVGIATAFFGALWFMPYAGVSLNMISMFAFLLILGIVVDDAIIVGESIYARQQEGMRGAAAAAGGAKMVAKPVLFAVISTMIFFAPMLDVPNTMGQMVVVIPLIVILSLLFSLIESLWILPSHLADMQPEQPSRFQALRTLARWRGKVANSLERIADNIYLPLLKKSLHHNGTTIAAFIAAFAIVLAIFVGGWIRTGFMPSIPSDYITVTAKLAEGSAFHETEVLLGQVNNAAEQLENDPELIAANDGSQDFIRHFQTWGYGNNIHVTLELLGGEMRSIGAKQVGARLRELIGPLPQVQSFDIDYTINRRGAGIRLRLAISSEDALEQERATRLVREALGRYPGVYNLRDTLEARRDQVELSLRPYADILGMGLNDIARQVRQGFYGEEVQRIPRDKEDVKVMLRYPRSERESLTHLEDMRIRSRDNTEVPLEAVANIDMVPGYSVIKRIDRKRSVTITADLRHEAGDARALAYDLINRNQEQWRRQFPGFSLEVDGNTKQQQEFMQVVSRNFMMALLAIFALMAVAFRSYWQPLIILTAVPFGFMGAIIGHIIMGREISIMSVLGFLACAGVVVNDNLVLMDRINQLRGQGIAVYEAVVQAGRDRFRPIILTSVTTFIGLVPIMAERSTQAQFLIPMVISLSFGVVFATSITLVLVPSLYLIAERAKAKINSWRNRAVTAIEGLEQQNEE